MWPRLVLLLTLAAGCASSKLAAGEIDAAEDSIDAPTAIDASATDGSIDGALDAAIDASTSTCPTQPCDLHQQCGCTGALACDIDFTDLMGTQCRAVNLPGTETSTCNSFSECSLGYVCVGQNPNSRCQKYCDMHTDCAQPRGQCVIQLMNGATPIAGATTCSSNCNPVNSAAGGCPAGWKCGFFRVSTPPLGGPARDIVDCTRPGTGTQGATCSNDTACASDFMCTTVNALQRCRRVCNRTAGGPECAGISGTTCLGFGTPLVVGGTEYGVCG